MRKTIKICNKTKNTIISEGAMRCPHLLQKAKGLMFSPQKDLIFEEKTERFVPLHMFFVFYAIDVLFLNKDKKVVEIKEWFKPFTFYSPQNKAQYIIELKSGRIAEARTAIGDHCEFIL
jgi:uncharacterized protein